MNINVNAAAAIAGTSKAAAKGGESDSQATQATRQQATAEAPGGKEADSAAIDAGDQAGDRGANGQQILDIFERHDEEDASDEEDATDDRHPESNDPANQSTDSDGAGSNLDLQA